MPLRLASRLLLCFALAALVLTGCDSGGPDADAGAVLVPSTSSLDFQTEEGDADTLEFALDYRNLDARPTPDDEIPPFYTLTQLEETGTPSSGRTTYSVIFQAPEESGSYAAPFRFRAGSAVATIRLGGLSVGGPEPITDFSDARPDSTGFEAFGGSIQLGVENEQLRLDASNVGGSGNFPGIFTVLDGPVNFEPTPVVAVRMMVTADSEGPARVRAALNQFGDAGLPDANSTIPDLLASVPADGEFRTYYFNFEGNFVQFDDQPVPPSNIGELVLLFNDNIAQTFTGTLFIDNIERRPDVPEDADVSNAAPTADFSFSPEVPVAGEPVDFTDRSVDPDGVIESFTWDFGDGATGSGASPSHTYSEAGTYTVRLTVTDDAGATAETSASVTVEDGGGGGGESVVELITDFTGMETGFIAFNGDITLALENEQLRVDANSVGGSGNFPGIATVFDAPVNFEPTPVVAVRMMVTADSPGPARIRVALNQDGNDPDANSTIPELFTEVPANGEFQTYYFNFEGNFIQFDQQPVDATMIDELVLLINDNLENTFTGTLFIDVIERRSDVPSGSGS